MSMAGVEVRSTSPPFCSPSWTMKWLTRRRMSVRRLRRGGILVERAFSRPWRPPEVSFTVLFLPCVLRGDGEVAEPADVAAERVA